MHLLLGQNHFSVEKMLDFDDFNECVTDHPTDRPADTAYYRDARTHLKRGGWGGGRRLLEGGRFLEKIRYVCGQFVESATINTPI